MSDNTVGMACVKMPKKFLPFIQKNQKLGEIVGLGILTISQYEQNIKSVKESLGDVDLLSALLEDGTKEELKEFIDAALDGQEFGILNFGDIPKEALAEVEKIMGDNMVKTEIPV